MLTDSKRHKSLHTAAYSEEGRVRLNRNTGLNNSFKGGTAVERRIQREETRVDEREEQNLWEPSPEINNKKLGLEMLESNIVS